MSQVYKAATTPVAPGVDFLTGNSGGPVGPDGLNNINVIGSGAINVVGNPGTNTLTISTTGVGIPWTRVVPNTQTLAPNNGYINTNAGLTTFTLPVASSFGQSIEILGEGAGGWIIAQNAGQNIQIGNTSSATGVLGSVASTNRYDSIRLVCRVDNTTWQAECHEGTLSIT